MESFKAKLNNAQNIEQLKRERRDLHLAFLNIIDGMLDAYTGEDKEYIGICVDFSFFHLNELLKCYHVLKCGTENPKDLNRLHVIASLLPIPDHLRDECETKIKTYRTLKGKLSVLRKYAKKADNTLMRLKEKLEKIKKDFRARKGLSKEEVETALDFLSTEVPLIVDIFSDRTDFAKRILKKKNVYRRLKGEEEYEPYGSDEDSGVCGDRNPRARKEKVEVNEVVRMLESIAGSSTGFTLVNGNVQSGKSGVLRCVSLFETLQGQTCVMILRNFNADCAQMVNGVKLFNQKYKEYMEARNFKNPKAMIKILHGSDILTKEAEFLHAFTSEPKLIILLANKSQTTRLNELLDDYSEEIEHFTVLIDEIDIHGYPSDTDVSTHEQIQTLMRRATSVFGTTATAFDVIFQEEDLSNDRMFSLPEVQQYRGVQNIIFKKLTERAKSPSRVKKDSDEFYDIFENDGNLQKVYYEMAEKRPEWQKNYNTAQPIICLHKTTEETRYHQLLFDWFVDDKCLNQAFAAVIFNGSGCRLYHHTLKGKKITIHGVKSCSTEEEQKAGIHLFKNVAIQEVYQWFKENGGTKKYRRIITISGKMAARGINFVSADYGWHLSHMYYLAAKGTPIPEMIQAMRLCGIYNDNIPLKCYTTEETIWEIKKGYNIQKDILERARKEQQEMNTKLWLRDLEFNQGKVPKRQLAKSIKVNRNLKKVGNKVDDGGIRFKSFEAEIRKNIEEDEWDEKYEYLREEEDEEEEEEEEEEDGKYSLILEDNVTSPLAKKILDAAEKIIINTGKTGKTILRAWINKKILELGRKEFKHACQLNGFWSNLIFTKNIKTNDINKKGLIFWQNQDGCSIFMRLNL